MGKEKNVDSGAHLFSENEKGIVQIDVVGEKEQIWQGLKTSLVQFLREFGQLTVNKSKNTTVVSEFHDYLAEASIAGKEFLKQFAVKNANIEAETIVKLREAERIAAETRRLNAETNKLELELDRENFDWALRKLQALITMGMIFAEGGDDNDDMLLFLKAAQSQLRIIKENIEITEK